VSSSKFPPFDRVLVRFRSKALFVDRTNNERPRAIRRFIKGKSTSAHRARDVFLTLLLKTDFLRFPRLFYDEIKEFYYYKSFSKIVNRPH
jgi:hypothetical protein